MTLRDPTLTPVLTADQETMAIVQRLGCEDAPQTIAAIHRLVQAKRAARTLAEQYRALYISRLKRPAQREAIDPVPWASEDIYG